ncbi:MAG TPA: metallophosphoesterase [Thermodesulfobacteriota bacterium]|jgi:hypothetical protein|nr:metallophosphoesterase [Thermodesulfobacteriota bacterium]
MRKSFHPKAILALIVLCLGITVWSTANVAYGDNRFTIAVIPDTQNYVDNTKTQPASAEEFVTETAYLATRKDALNLVFVTHVGDVVQHGDGTNGTPGDKSYGAQAEWDRALCAMKILADADIPFGMSPGNHDYDNYSYTSGNRPLTSKVMWNRYFGSRSWLFAFKPWYGGASDQLDYDPGLSSFQIFEAGGKNFLHISLQMEPSDAALAWAQGVIDAHPNYATIVTTHSYLSPPPAGDNQPPFAEPATRNAAGYLTTSGTCTGGPQNGTSPGGCNSAQQVWDKFISKNDQIFMVLCGHSWNPTDASGISQGENIRIDNNISGHPVYQVLSDYQGNTVGTDGVVGHDPGGEGWLRLMEFNMNGHSIHFRTYSPVLDQYAGLNGEASFEQPAAFSDFVGPMPIQVLNASSAREHDQHGPVECQEICPPELAPFHGHW